MTMYTPYLFDLLGTLMFAISGALAASEKQINKDLFSVTFIGFITALGGGSLRDIMLGRYPLIWIRDINYILVIALGVTLAILFRVILHRYRKVLFLFDTIGIGFYTIVGTQLALSMQVNPLAASLLGLFSAVFGGVIRDTLLNDIPLIFRKEVYATACLAGAFLFVGLRWLQVPDGINYYVSAGLIIGIRLLSVKRKWQLPEMI
jgi:uncharacterized membrane protein YeiH